MDQFIVSARKYRPSNFNSVIGQSSLTLTLKNAILTNHLAHAYLFCGPRGVGKTTCARIFAKTINCLSLTQQGEACNECESCRAFNEQRSMNIFELDAASNNSVDDIRELVKSVYIPPQIGKYSVYIVDEVHMLSASAFNAFLKTLEEPPAYAKFILATTEKHKILPTIISRCQIYDFKRIEVADTMEYLRYVAKNENVAVEDEAFNIIAQKADGAMRDALSIFDQVVSFCGSNITYKAVIENLNVMDYEYYFRLVDKFQEGNVVEALLIFNEILNKGFDGQNFVSGLASHLRDILVSRDSATLPLLQVSGSVAKQYSEQAIRCPQMFLYKALDIVNSCDLNYRTSRNKRLLVELMLMKLCRICFPEEKQNDNVPIKKTETNNNSETVENKSVTQPVEKNATQEEAKQVLLTRNLSQGGGLSTILNPQKEEKTEPNTIENQIVESQKAEKNPADAISQNFSEAQLFEAWKKYSETITDNFQSNYAASAVPQKENNFCKIVTLNDTQMNFLMEKKTEIEDFLMKELKNQEIKLLIEKGKVEENKKLSPEDRLEEMKHENPLLNNLISELRLEIIY
ncbi:MAG: DNA polymerase III subunit gamma/tau [Prevotellaceae bacterium]|jgi:DNA polymerase-3 subunit gamma/tau|nr:DNA polymerase III subunit gamma/tau [Prevotellaceae bacterium]